MASATKFFTIATEQFDRACRALLDAGRALDAAASAIPEPKAAAGVRELADALAAATRDVQRVKYAFDKSLLGDVLTAPEHKTKIKNITDRAPLDLPDDLFN